MLGITQIFIMLGISNVRYVINVRYLLFVPINENRFFSIFSLLENHILKGTFLFN